MAKTISFPRRALLAACLALPCIGLAACGVSPEPEPEPTATPTIAIIATIEPLPTSTSPAAAAPAATVPAPQPGASPSFANLPSAAAEYLTAAGGDVSALANALGQWDMTPPQGGELAAFALGPAVMGADLDGDGTEEVIVSAVNPRAESVTGEGVLFILGQSPEGQYLVEYSTADGQEPMGPVSILAVQDADGDRVADVAFASESCGAHTCSAQIQVLAHRGDGYANLAPGVASDYPDLIRLEDVTGDGRLEILLHGNLIGSVGAGPQRASTRVYRLEDDQYRLYEVRYDLSNLLYFAITDANAALAAGDTAEAVDLYQAALADPDLIASGLMQNGMDAAQELQTLRSFARFRLVVALALQADTAPAEQALAEARADGGPFLPATEAFWAGFTTEGTVDAGCLAVTDLTATNPDLLDILNSFGYANPWFTEEQLCRGAGTGSP